MSTNYDHYRVFHQVVKSGSISGAADELFLTQSTVSRIIQSLERSLNSILFIRSKQGVSLTEEGILLFRHLNTAIEHINIAEERIGSRAGLDEGQLRIGASELTLKYFILPYLKRLKAAHPNISLRLSYSTPQAAIEDLRSGLLDMAVLASPVPLEIDINITPLKEIEYILISGPAYSEFHNKSVYLREIMGHPFISGEKGMAVREFSDSVAKLSRIELKPEYEVGSLLLMISMVQLDMGLGFAPYEHVEEPLREKSIFQINLKQKLPKGHICVMTSKKSYNDRITECFLDILNS